MSELAREPAEPRSRAAEAATGVCARCGAVVTERYCELCGAARGAVGPDDRLEVVVGRAAGVSDRGARRRGNEDALALHGVPGRGIACVICDGVSGGPRGRAAAEAATRTGSTELVAALAAGVPAIEATASGLHAAAAAVARLADHDGAPACTYVSVVAERGVITVGWVGDSRVYWIPAGVPPRGVRLTEDDSWRAAAVASGRLSPAQAAADRRAHTITGWLGADNDGLRAHLMTCCPIGSGTVVACTDGLWGHLDEPGLLATELPGDAPSDPLGAARELVRAALRDGGRDNVTVAVIPLDDRGEQR